MTAGRFRKKKPRNVRDGECADCGDPILFYDCDCGARCAASRCPKDDCGKFVFPEGEPGATGYLCARCGQRRGYPLQEAPQRLHADRGGAR